MARHPPLPVEDSMAELLGVWWVIFELLLKQREKLGKACESLFTGFLAHVFLRAVESRLTDVQDPSGSLEDTDRLENYRRVPQDKIVHRGLDPQLRESRHKTG